MKIKKFNEHLQDNMNENKNGRYNVIATQNVILDWNVVDDNLHTLPNPDVDVLTLCNNSGDLFYKVQYYSKNHENWSESTFVIAWCELPEFPNL